MSAGKLTERVTLASRVTGNPDDPTDYGNPVAGWEDVGNVAAQFIYLRGGEAVIAGRLQGRQPVVIRVWATPLTRQVSSDWRVTDARRGTVYAVRSVNPDPEGDRAWIDLLCESGVAA
jgi:SPP1 family predicted phage head-tail adaptor